MPPKKRKTNMPKSPGRGRLSKSTKTPAHPRAHVVQSGVIDFTAETGPARLRTGRIRVVRVSFISDVSALTPSQLRRLRARIENLVQDLNDDNNGVLDGEFVFTGAIRTENDGENEMAMLEVIRDADVASLAYLLREGGHDYFIATPPVKHGVQRRVHLLLGRHDRNVYVRKLVYSDQKPTEATLWPQTMGQSLRPGLTLEESLPGVPRLISCVNLGKDPNDTTADDQKVAVWSIISEWLPGVTLERLNKYLASEPQLLTYKPTNPPSQNHNHIIRQIGADLLRAVKSLEAEGKVHQDLTPANVLVSQAGGSMPSVSLIDFSTMRTLNAPTDSAIPNDGALIKVKDGFGVFLCLADMLAVKFGNYRPGKANRILADKAEAQWLKDFQTQTQSSNEPGQWDNSIADFQTYADTPAEGRLNEIIPPCGHKFGPEMRPAEPLAFAKRHKVTSQAIPTTPVTPFTIGPHRKVWIEPFAWEVLEEVGNLGW